MHNVERDLARVINRAVLDAQALGLDYMARMDRAANAVSLVRPGIAWHDAMTVVRLVTDAVELCSDAKVSYSPLKYHTEH